MCIFFYETIDCVTPTIRYETSQPIISKKKKKIMAVFI